MIALINEISPQTGKKAACEALSFPRATFYRSTQDEWPEPKQRPEPPLALTAEERQSVSSVLHSDQFCDDAPHQVYAKLLDEGVKIVVKMYGGGVMGSDTDVLRKMDVGQLDSCACTALGILDASPEMSVFLLPGMYKNYDEVDYIGEKFRQRLDKAFEERGYILAAFQDSGFFYLFSKYKIGSLADFKAQKVLTWFGDIEVALYKELGIHATPIAAAEMVSALSTGLADAQMAPMAWMIGMQAYQYVNYYIKPPILYSPAVVVISRHIKEKMIKRFDISEIFAHNILEMLVYEINIHEQGWKEMCRKFEDRSVEALETKGGLKAVTLSAEDQKIIEQAALRVQEKLADVLYSRTLMDDIQEALKDYRSSNNKR